MTPKDRAERGAEQVAERVAEAMWAADAASKALGMEMVSVDEGRATIALTVQADHANGHGICHGGIIFALADTAFAFACNSRNQSTVAYHNAITYLAPAQIGDRLIAEAQEVTLAGRNGITDVEVRRAPSDTTDEAEGDSLIARFRGHSRALRGPVVDEAL